MRQYSRNACDGWKADATHGSFRGMASTITFADYLEWRAVSDPEARTFLEKSDRATLERRPWAELMHLFTEQGREMAYILEARQLHMEFARQTAGR